MTQPLKLELTAALLTGDEIIDTQHKYLIEIINDVAEVIETGQVEEKLGPILPLLQYFCEWHFEREELCMHQRRCPMAAANKHAHGIFLKAFEDFKAEYHRDGPSDELARRMYTTLTDWLVNHIQKIDTSISTCEQIHEA